MGINWIRVPLIIPSGRFQFVVRFLAMGRVLQDLGLLILQAEAWGMQDRLGLPVAQSSSRRGSKQVSAPLSTPFLREIHVGDTSVCTRLAYAAAEPHCGADTLPRDLQSLK